MEKLQSSFGRVARSLFTRWNNYILRLEYSTVRRVMVKYNATF